MRIIHHPEAEREFAGVALYYEALGTGLGGKFVREFERAFFLIVRDPECWRKFRGENRKVNLRTFPYAIVYSYEDGVIFIKAVMHLHRRPFYWEDRK